MADVEAPSSAAAISVFFILNSSKFLCVFLGDAAIMLTGHNDRRHYADNAFPVTILRQLNSS